MPLGATGRRNKVSQEAERAKKKHICKLFLLQGRKLLGRDSPYLARREAQMLGTVVGNDLLYHFQTSTKPRRQEGCKLWQLVWSYDQEAKS